MMIVLNVSIGTIVQKNYKGAITMACVNEKGQLSPAGKKLLGSLAVESLTTQDISKNSGLPIFKVRSNLREMLNAELIIEENNQYKISEKGKQILEKNNLDK